jgi:hypothetical protein
MSELQQKEGTLVSELTKHSFIPALVIRRKVGRYFIRNKM